MPLYVYRCEVCGHEVEELQKMGVNDPPVEEPCPEGGSCTMTKAITGAGFKFIGEGWGGHELKAGGFVQRRILGRKNTLTRKKKRVADDGV